MDGYDMEELSSIEAEDALADEFCEWVRSWQTVPAQGSTPGRVVSGARVSGLLGIGRTRILSVMNNRLHGERGWRQANQLVRQGWLANRKRWLLMGLAELELEEEERGRKKKAASLGAEAEVHDDDAPYATADDDVALPASGVSVEDIDTGSTPLAGKPREVEQGAKPDEDASQPDAKPSIIPSDAPDATALTPVTPADVPVTPADAPTGSDDASAAADGAPAVSEAPAQTPVIPLSDAPAADASAGASAGVSPDVPVGDAPADAPVAAGPVGNASVVNASLDAPAASVGGAGMPSEEVGAPVASEPALGAAVGGDGDEDASGADASGGDAGVEEATAGGYATGGASAGDGYGGALAEVKLSLTGEPLMPAGLDLEEMVALIDAKNARRYGQDPFTIEIDGRVIDVSRDADFDFLVDMIVRAQTREEVARLCDGPVLAVYPGLSLVDAKTCAILRVSGWHPTEQDRKPPGLHGDAPLMLYYGIDATFVDPGAMAVAFAKTLMWHNSHDLSAMRMRYGIAQRRRRLRYALDAFLNRTYMLGFRQSDWIPELAWPDSDWFFGSVPWVDPAGRWWPSRAQLIEYWYCVHDTQLAFAGSEAETRDTGFWLQIEREKLLTEHLLIGEPYMMTFEFHGFGRTLPHSTRNMERRVMRERIAQIDQELKRRRRAGIVRRIRRLGWSDLFAGRLRDKRIGEFKAVRKQLRDAATQEKIEEARIVFEEQKAELQKQVTDFEASWGEVVLSAKSIPQEQITRDDLYDITYINGYPMLQAQPYVEPEPVPKTRLGRVLEWVFGRPKALGRLIMRMLGKLLRAPKALWRWLGRIRLPFGITFSAREEDEQAREDRLEKETKKAKNVADKLDEKLKKRLAKEQKAAARDLLPRHRVVLFGIVVRRAWPFGWFRYEMYEHTGQLACGSHDSMRWERWYEPGTPIMQQRYNLIKKLDWYALMPEVRVYRVAQKETKKGGGLLEILRGR